MVKILIVDDEESISRLYEKEFMYNGFETQVATDGEDALVKAKAYQPDFILLDIMLPKLDGIQVYKKMQQDEELRTIPVAFLSALGEDIANVVAPEEKKVIEQAAMFWQKDQLTPQQLVEAVRKYLRPSE